MCVCVHRGPPRLNYTILYNSTRLLMLKQLILGADNGKPDGRAGEMALCVCVCVCV